MSKCPPNLLLALATVLQVATVLHMSAVQLGNASAADQRRKDAGQRRKGAAGG